MKPSAPLLLALLAPLSLLADWPQWRGANGNGISAETTPLLSRWTGGDLKPLWESEEIPCNDDCGYSSVVVAGGRAYVSVVWHRDEPSETRQITDAVLRQLGFQNTRDLGPELVKKLEEARLALSPSLRGRQLEEYAKKWTVENLDAKQQQAYAAFIAARFKKGPLAAPLELLEKLDGDKKRLFASGGELVAWLESQGFDENTRAQVVAAVPPTRRVAEDVVFCLDLATGQTAWKNVAAGEPAGRGASSTPCVANGKAFALGSISATALDASSGQLLWSVPLKQKGPGASPVATGDVVVINAKCLYALDATSGRERWKLESAGGGNSSPVLWRTAGRTFVICQGRSTIDAVDAQTGQLAWSVPGSGESTPAIQGDLLAVQTKRPQAGLIVYRISPESATQLWLAPYDAFRTQASPIVEGESVYLIDNEVQQCFDAVTGHLRWSAPVPGSISSPALADGKLFTLTNNGNNLQVLRADGTQRVELGKANVKAAWVPSPTVADGKLLVRLKDRVRCYSLSD